MTAKRDKKQAYRQKKVVKEMKMCPFFMVDRNFELLAFGIVTCTNPEVTLLSEELSYQRRYDRVKRSTN